MYNIPNDLSTNDLKELFSEFGTVLSATIEHPKQSDIQNGGQIKRPVVGFVLFASPAEAAKAMQAANGKFLGPN